MGEICKTSFWIYGWDYSNKHKSGSLEICIFWSLVAESRVGRVCVQRRRHSQMPVQGGRSSQEPSFLKGDSSHRWPQKSPSCREMWRRSLSAFVLVWRLAEKNKIYASWKFLATSQLSQIWSPSSHCTNGLKTANKYLKWSRLVLSQILAEGSIHSSWRKHL